MLLTCSWSRVVESDNCPSIGAVSGAVRTVRTNPWQRSVLPGTSLPNGIVLQKWHQQLSATTVKTGPE